MSTDVPNQTKQTKQNCALRPDHPNEIAHCPTLPCTGLVNPPPPQKKKVDPETYRVTADGEHLTCEPLKELPLAQRYFVF